MLGSMSDSLVPILLLGAAAYVAYELFGTGTTGAPALAIQSGSPGQFGLTTTQVVSNPVSTQQSTPQGTPGGSNPGGFSMADINAWRTPTATPVAHQSVFATAAIPFMYGKATVKDGSYNGSYATFDDGSSRKPDINAIARDQIVSDAKIAADVALHNPAGQPVGMDPRFQTCTGITGAWIVSRCGAPPSPDYPTV